jgi:hypothetical protein
MRTTHKVDRNVGDAIRAWGGLSAQSVALLAGGYALLQLIELVSGLWSLVFGAPGGFVFPLLATLVTALVLSRLERSHGAHYAAGVVRFHLLRRARFVYSPFVRPRFERSPCERPRR